MHGAASATSWVEHPLRKRGSWAHIPQEASQRVQLGQMHPLPTTKKKHDTITAGTGPAASWQMPHVCRGGRTGPRATSCHAERRRAEFLPGGCMVAHLPAPACPGMGAAHHVPSQPRPRLDSGSGGCVMRCGSRLMNHQSRYGSTCTVSHMCVQSRCPRSRPAEL